MSSLRLRAALILMMVAALPAQGADFARGRMVEGLSCAVDPTATYSLYLPSGYTTEKRWPVLLIFDARGRSVRAAERFVAAAERYGWVLVSSNDTRSDESWDPNVKAVNALWPEIHDRLAIDKRRIYATGFSGGAMVAWVLGMQSGRLAGVIGCGGRYEEDFFPKEDAFAHFGTAGDQDFNYQGMRDVDQCFEGLRSRHRLEVFEGVHQWMPPAMATEAVEWMEVQAMATGDLEVDGEWLSEVYEKDAGRARELEASGEIVAAMRRWQAIARTYEGLLDVGSARNRASQLAADSRVVATLKKERTWDAFEAKSLRQLQQTLGRIEVQDVPMPASRVVRELGLKRIKNLAAGNDRVKALAAQRSMETIFVQFAFYLPRDYIAASQWRMAETVLDVASRIKPDVGYVRYNLACAQAHNGRADEALENLEAAVRIGVGNATMLQEDPDLVTLREEPRFQTLLSRLAENS